MLKKNQTSISQDIDEKILSMYAKGMTMWDIETHIQEIYSISGSDSTVGRITDKILPVAREWQQLPLESIYAVVFLDAIHCHVRKRRADREESGSTPPMPLRALTASCAR